MDGLLKLESNDTRSSRDAASKIHSRLKSTRDPLLLGELVDFYFQTYSKRTRKILTTLGEAHSQDYFEKLLDCLQNGKILPVFKLLAHTLNSQHANWLYRIVDHPLFSTILEQLKVSEDVMVLAMGVLVVAAILPLVPTYITSHLEQLFSIFCDLATIRATSRLGLTPNELVMHLDVSVYYFFLQLYALFPCNLFSFLKSYCLNSSRPQVEAFQEFVAPLFYQVQLHPGLVMDSCSYELSKAKWGAMDPSDIATLSLQFCVDHLLTEQEDVEVKDGLCNPVRQPSLYPAINQSSTVLRPSSLTLHIPAPEVSSSHELGSSKSERAQQEQQSQAPPQTSDNCSSTATSEMAANLLQPTNNAGLSSNPGGLKPEEELCKFWSPSVSLGQISTQSSTMALSDSQNSSLHLPAATSSLHFHQHVSTSSLAPSPKLDSAMSSVNQTPLVLSTSATAGGGHGNVSVLSTSSVPSAFTLNKNYSPTASVDGESLFSRQMLSQSVAHTPSMLEESFSSRQLDLMSQSVRLDLSSSHLSTSPSKVSRSFSSKGSFKNRLSSFFGIAKKDQDVDVVKDSPVPEKECLNTNETDDFVEVFIGSDNADEQGLREKEGEGMQLGMSVSIEKGEEVKAESVEVAKKETLDSSVQDSNAGVTSSGQSDSPEDSHRDSGFDGMGQMMDLDISTLPLSNRISRSSSESSQTNRNLEQSNDSPNTAGTGRFDACDQQASSYNYNSINGLSTTTGGRMSSSYPKTVFARVGGGVEWRTSDKRHKSNSETIQCVRDRLQELVEESRDSALSKSQGAETKLEAGATISGENLIPPVVAGSSDPLLASSSTNELSRMPGLSPMHGRPMTLRRVSVCSRKSQSGALKFQSESSDGGGTSLTTQDLSTDQKLVSLPVHPSPVALLDQFVTCGEVLHCGGLDMIPLTEQEGIDWNHFGGCPHSEEFRIMQSQVVLLHSQMLFERHQCRQHAKRNRRLLSKARSATHVAQELVSLQDQMHQQESLVSSLQHQLSKASESQVSRQPFTHDTDRSTVRQCETLKDRNAKLEEQLRESEMARGKLEEDLQMANKRIFDLENAQQDSKTHLERAGDLQREVKELTSQLHMLSGLYQQQGDRLRSFRLLSQQEAEWNAKMAALAQEKEEAVRENLKLKQQLEGSRAQLEEHEVEKQRWEKDLQKMRVQREEERGRAWTKIKTLEDKYSSMRVIGQQLESHVLELKGRGPLHRKKTHSRHKRNRSSSCTMPFSNIMPVT